MFRLTWDIRTPVLPAARDLPVSEAHPQSSECSSWQPVEKEPDHWDRMVPAPRHSEPDVLHLVHSRIGSVCNFSQSQAACVCVSSSRSLSSSGGCSVHSVDWQWVYACPSTALMQRVSHKFAHSDHCGMRLVAPLQHYRPWLPTLLALLVDFPQEIPLFPCLLRQPQLWVFHNHPEQVPLLVWSLLSVPCETNSFLRQLPGISARQLEHLTPAFMTASGECMRVGVVCNKLVLSKPLFNNQLISLSSCPRLPSWVLFPLRATGPLLAQYFTCEGVGIRVQIQFCLLYFVPRYRAS